MVCPVVPLRRRAAHASCSRPHPLPRCCRLYSAVVVLGMAASDLWGKRILWGALMAGAVPPAAMPLLLTILHPLVGVRTLPALLCWAAPKACPAACLEPRPPPARRRPAVSGPF